MTEFSKNYKKRSQLYNNVVKACQHLLYNSPAAKSTLEYLDSRLPRDVQSQYGFGYFPDNDNLNLLLSIVPLDELKELNIIYPKFVASGSYLSGHFSDHNMILPFYDLYGNIISILGRCLLPDNKNKEFKVQKYKYSLGSNKDLYVYGLDKAIDSIIEKGCVIGVEGQFDCIACQMRGISNVVAFGWANLSRYQFFQLHRYTNNFIIMTDSDEAGVKARDKIKKRYSNFSKILTLSPPKGYKDIESFLRECSDSGEVERVVNRLKTIHQEF